MLIPTLLATAGAAGAVTFPYSISCSPLTIGPDTIQAYSQSNSVNLVPNVANVSNTVDFFNAQTNVVFSGTPATLNGTLLCSFTLGGVTVSANRPFTLVITEFIPVVAAPASAVKPKGIPSSAHETHTFTFAAFSFNVVIPGQGTVTVSQGIHTDLATLSFGVGANELGGQAATPSTVLNVDPASSSLLFVPLPPVPVPPSIILTLSGIGAAGWYETRRRKMAALRPS